MIKKGGVITKKKFGRTADPALAKEKAKGTPVMVFLPKVLRSRVKLACIALGANTSTVVRELLEEWVKSKQKAIAAVVNMSDAPEDEDEEEDADTEDAADEDEDEDEDED